MAKLVIALASPLLCTAADASTGGTPVQVVVELMTGMLVQGKSEKQEEVVQFAAYKQFCEDTSASKKTAIREANEHIELLQADIEKYTAKAAKLKMEIEAHDADMEAWTGDKTAATKVRALEKADYDALHADYSESVDALQRAIEVLKKKDANLAQASFAQVSALSQVSLIPDAAKKAIAAFLQARPEGLEVSAPEAYGYEFQSTGIVDMLEKLLDKFIEERTAVEKKEMNSKDAFQMLIQDLDGELKVALKDRTEKAESRAKTLQAKADAKGDLVDTTTTRDADQEYLADLVATCEQKATDFESRQQLREEELEAVGKAISIISSESVAGTAETYLPSFAQTPSSQGPALAMLRADMHNEAQARAARFLRKQATKLDSRVLSALASHATADPFQKVKKMIKDLIVRLMEEANEETEHKGWCDTELSTNEQTRQGKTEAVETLHAEIDQLETSIATLTEDIADLTQAVADLDAAMKKATKLRLAEKAENEQTIKDSQAAQTAVAKAMVVLREFYEKAAEATALLQQQPEAPEIFDAPYKGMQAENGGVIGMLEVIESDFARLEADTRAAEAAAQKEYQDFMTESKMDHAAKSKSIELKTAKKANSEQALETNKADLEGTQKELTAALAYFDKLKPSCIDAGVSYEDRVTRRKEEIESLQEALRILNGEDLA